MSLETSFQPQSSTLVGQGHDEVHGVNPPVALPRMRRLGHEATSLQWSIKRLVDFFLSLLGLFFLAPFLLAVAAAIKFTSKGPILFSQLRWGKNGRHIRIYKFRTMYLDCCDESGVKQTQKDDPRVTPVGRLLRKYSIDEFPQLLNVLKGDMSLVGPRCHAIGMQAAGMDYEKLVPYYHLRHRVRPGITGLAQAKGYRGPTDIARVAKARIAYDIIYIEHYSLLLDMKIIFKTIWMEISGGTGV